VARLVVDTNVFASAIMLPGSIPRRAVNKALDFNVLLFSDHTLDELREVLFRSKFDRYVSRKARALFLVQLESVAEVIPVIQIVRECRDPGDDKFLEVALNGSADLIITGDADLQRMNPWREIAVESPGEYLRR
jgi:putative PIN family toxin of toxin-antitoxin system